MSFLEVGLGRLAPLLARHGRAWYRSGVPINDSAPQSLSAYARHRGCNKEAVRRAVKAGRLTGACVARDADGNCLGIFDFATADREWAENTSADHRERATGAARGDGPEIDAENPTALVGMTKAQADTVTAIWKAKRSELEFKQAAGELVPARDVAQKLAGVFSQCKTRLMALPSRARQELPHLSVGDIGVLETIIREALEDLAAAGAEVVPDAEAGE